MAAVFAFTASNKPIKSRFISAKELAYIERELADQGFDDDDSKVRCADASARLNNSILERKAPAALALNRHFDGCSRDLHV